MYATLLATTIFAVAGSAFGQAGTCPEAARFGFFKVTPTMSLTGGEVRRRALRCMLGHFLIETSLFADDHDHEQLHVLVV
jgi:hypothetical protein